MSELLEIWELYLKRRRLEAEGDAAALAALPEVSALDGLRANADLVSRLTVQRWIAMKDAQDQGASLEQIGSELGVTRQAAWEFMQRRIADHREKTPPDDAA